jgi:hypothetical protein
MSEKRCCQIKPGEEIVVKCCCGTVTRPVRKVLAIRKSETQGVQDTVLLSSPVLLASCSNDEPSDKVGIEYVHQLTCEEVKGEGFTRDEPSNPCDDGGFARLHGLPTPNELLDMSKIELVEIICGLRGDVHDLGEDLRPGHCSACVWPQDEE